MVEALIAFVAAVLIIAVFSGPVWALKLGQFGGLGFALYVLILVIKYLLGLRKSG
jgi:hypothetical protein